MLATALALFPMACPAPEPPGAASADAVSADVAAYARALAAIRSDPAGAAAACAPVRDPNLAADCLTAAAEALADNDPDGAEALCVQLPAGVGRDECHFQVAERARDVTRCDRAGAFADDCRLHRLSADFGRLIPRGARPGGFEADLAAALPDYGLAVDDPRPWSAAYRWVLGSHRPLDRGSCDAVADPDRAEACRHTAVALFDDLLNHARDTRTFPCDGGPLPDRLAHAPDPVLDQRLAERRARDLCP